ncbi:MAG: DNA polymerase III subunit delta [Phycisphaerales bacterium]
MAKREPATNAPQRPLSADIRVALFTGKDSFLRALYTQELRDVLTATHGEVDVITFDGETATPADVLDECRSFGLIAKHKLVSVENAADLVKLDARPLFENYCKSPSDGATLVLRSETWHPGNLDKVIAQNGTIRDCGPLEDARAAAWAATRCSKRHRATLDPAAGAALVERIGTDLARLDSELAKLAIAAGEGGTITPALVNELVGLARDEEAWHIQRTLLSGRAEESLAHVRYILDVARQPSPKVMWAITDLARKLHGLSRAAKLGQNTDAAARSLKIWGGAKDEILRAGSRVPPARALRLLEACVEIDARSKSGLGEMDANIERLTLEFARTVSGS